MLFMNSSTVRDKNNAPKVESDRITKLEQMFGTLLKKIDNIDESKKVNKYVAIVVKLIMPKVRASN